MAKPALFSARVGEPNDESTLSVYDLVTKIERSSRQALHGRRFTSHVSCLDAVAMQVEDVLDSLELKQYVDFEGLKLTSLSGRGAFGGMQWLHERYRSKVSPYLDPICTLSMPSGFNLRPEKWPTVNETGVGVMSVLICMP